jgi:dihydrofolate synthase/folylpolyglutamate synthase
VRYQQAIAYLYALAPRGMSLGLRPIRRALALRGNPERGFRSVHVAGTNGKGSVAAMVASVLSASGQRVGLFTSPHLHRLVERFRVDGRPMPERELARRVAELARFVASPRAPKLTFFEVCTLLAFEWFRDEGCDLAVIEVGIGGRLDSTNVIMPEVSVITSVALDHQDKLGSTLRQIAREKAGIIKPGVPIVARAEDEVARAVIARRARALSAPLTWAAPAPRVSARTARRQVSWRRRSVSLSVPLTGDHQDDNLGCALAALACLRERGWPITSGSLARGLSRVRWPGRLELLSGAPDVLCDAAHNPAAAQQLAAHLRALGGRYPRKVLLFGVLNDKNYAEMLATLLPCFDRWVFATPESPRAQLSGLLRARFGGEACDDLDTALKRARKLAKANGLVVAAGSIFLMSAVRARVLGLRDDPKIAL